MLYKLLIEFMPASHFANLFNYITFRCGIALTVSLMIWIIFGRTFITSLRTWQTGGQPIRKDGPESHHKKSGTPTMGGILIVGASIISSLLLCKLEDAFVWIVLGVFAAHCLLGFMDDYLKLKKRNSDGVRGKVKLVVQILVSLVAIYYAQKFSSLEHQYKLAFPFFKNFMLDLGTFYLLFGAFVIVGASNAVNLTDGLDGLAAVPVIFCLGCFGIISYLCGNKVFADYLQINYVQNIGEVAVISSAVIGSLLGFLWYNVQPAEVFMGDTGSLALGGLLGIISVITKHEFVLAIAGFIFVIEAISVILQVYYFKLSGGKRLFLMAPIHHHFEKKGWPESKVVVRFWILSALFAIIGLSTLKLR